MARIHILGGTGYAGRQIARAAARNGHQVVSFSRDRPADEIEGVAYRSGDVLDDAFLASAFDDADVVISALSAVGPFAEQDKLRALLRKAARMAADRGVRFGVIGGAGSLLTEPGGSRLVDTPDFPEAAKPMSLELAGALDDLKAVQDERLDWFFVSPAANFGAHAPGEATGRYRIGADVVLRDANGDSELSAPDLALAVVEEIEKPVHRRRRFTVAY
ncbi:MAG TPA: NAD(P)H-binding protein [Hyphomicrobium sp.]|nr:NAD(P)H-binding protein [Hyphomicrobium sp.]